MIKVMIPWNEKTVTCSYKLGVEVLDAGERCCFRSSRWLQGNALISKRAAEFNVNSMPSFTGFGLLNKRSTLPSHYSQALNSREFGLVTIPFSEDMDPSNLASGLSLQPEHLPRPRNVAGLLSTEVPQHFTYDPF
jgi:hypothetical protein